MKAKEIVSALLEAENLEVRDTDVKELERSGVVQDFGDNAWGDCSDHGDPLIILVNDVPVGWMQVTYNNEVNVIEIKPEFQRKGYATRAIQSLLGDTPEISDPVSAGGRRLVKRFAKKK